MFRAFESTRRTHHKHHNIDAERPIIRTDTRNASTCLLLSVERTFPIICWTTGALPSTPTVEGGTITQDELQR